MHYVIKGDAPDCFTADTNNFDTNTNWNEFQNPCKSTTKDHILAFEQYYLCVYCERKISSDNSRIEHIKPQSVYPAERFNYSNLVVSCHGKDDPNLIVQSHHGYNVDSCDHFKGNLYDETLFLNPASIEDISDFFKFDLTKGTIYANDNRSPENAKYMIEKLNLDNPSLRNERINAKSALIKRIQKLPKEKWKEALDKLLTKKDLAFISFLRYFYSSVAG